MFKDPIEDLRHEHEIAMAKLGVSEDLAWPLAMLASYAIGSQFGWIYGVIVFVAVFYYVPNEHRKREMQTMDAYYQAAKLGKYATWLQSQTTKGADESAP